MKKSRNSSVNCFHLHVRIWTAAFSLSVVLTLLTTIPVSAKYMWPAIGGSGDADVVDECPQGQYLVGFKGRSGAWIDQIQIVCSSLAASGHRVGTLFYGPNRGGTGGAPSEMTCDSGYVGTQLYFAGDRQILWVELFCETLNSSKTNPAFLRGTGNEGGEIQNQRCNRSEIAKGLRIHYGKHVNALGLICDKLVPSGPTPAAAAPKVFDNTFATATDLSGSDYRNAVMNDKYPSTCRDLCQKEDRCKAWTWVKPGVQGLKAVCWLKNAVPVPRVDANCVSGVKVSGSLGLN